MGKVHVSIVKSRATSEVGGSLPVPASLAIGTSETIVSSSSSRWTSLTADAATLGSTDPRGFVWRVAVGGTEDVYVGFVATSTEITAANGFLCPAGGVYEFGVTTSGNVCGVINA